MRTLALTALGLCLPLAPALSLDGSHRGARSAQEGEAPAPSEPDVWAPVRGLIGTWEGTSEGKFGPAELETTWELVLGGAFLQSRTRSVSRNEVHEDLGMLSYDRERERFVFRAFYSEGYVNRYLVSISEDGRTLQLETESVENGLAPGLRARNTIVLTGSDVLTTSLSLAAGGDPYELCVSSRLMRKR